MKRVKEDLISMAHVDMEPRQAGRNINMQLSPLPERQRVRKFKSVNRNAKLIDDNSDFEEDDHHDDHPSDSHGAPAVPAASAERPAPPAAGS
jgi:translation initiation factor IF-3